MKTFWKAIYILAIIFSLPFIGLFFLIDEPGDCISSGYVWDYDLKQCRKDCLHWNKKTGCIKLTQEEVLEFKECQKQHPKCLAPIYKKMFPQKCFEYNGAYNTEENYCDFEFDLKDCYKLKGNWHYPTICKN